jgi:hypothetical protein
MTSPRLRLITALALAVGFTSAQAQPPAALGPTRLAPSSRPVTSPYLNLAIDDGTFDGPAYQYYRRVRPEIELRRANASLTSELRDVRRQMGEQPPMAQSPASGIGSTGHPVSYQSFGRFYPGFSRR